MTARLGSPQAILILSLVIGIISTTVTVFLGRNIGVSVLLAMCVCYAISVFVIEKSLTQSAVILISSVLLSGLVAVASGFILVRFILKI